MNLTREIKNIETRTNIDPDWYYHSFNYSKDSFTNMLTEGIKCRKLIPSKFKDKNIGHNGNHYISLSKLYTGYFLDSAYYYYDYEPAFIIEDIKTRECHKSSDYKFLRVTRWPIRYSGFDGEYQAYRIITPEKYHGLRCNLLQWYIEGQRYYLYHLQQMLLYMKEKNISLPVLDYSRMIEGTIQTVDQEGFLDIYNDLYSSLERVRR